MLNNPNSLKLQKGNSENTIIVTQIGKQKITKENDWVDESFANTGSNSNLNNSNITLGNVNNMGNSTAYLNNTKKQNITGRVKMCYSVSNSSNRNYQKPQISIGPLLSTTFTEQYSTKVQKRHKQWTSTRTNFTLFLKHTLEQKQVEKYKEIQWPQETSKCRRNIAEILQNWKSEQETQEERTKIRLENIYKDRYRVKKGQKKQKIINFEQRSFNEPSKFQCVNYRVAEDFKGEELKADQGMARAHKGNKENKIYYRIKKKWNQSFQNV